VNFLTFEFSYVINFFTYLQKS